MLIAHALLNQGCDAGGASFSKYMDGYADFQKYMQGHGSSGDFSKYYQQYMQQRASQGGGYQKYSDQGGERSACKQQNLEVNSVNSRRAQKAAEFNRFPSLGPFLQPVIKDGLGKCLG